MSPPLECEVCGKGCYGTVCSMICSKEYRRVLDKELDEKYGTSFTRGGERRN